MDPKDNERDQATDSGMQEQEPNVVSAFTQLTEARASRDSLLEERQEGGADEREWEERYSQADELVAAREAAWQDSLKDMSLEDLDELRGAIDKRREEVRQANNQDLEHPDLETWRAQRRGAGQEDKESAGQGQQGGQGQWMDPHHFDGRGYYPTNADAEEAKQLEEDQGRLAQLLGRNATSDEVQAYQEERAAREREESSVEEHTTQSASDNQDTQDTQGAAQEPAQEDQDVSQQVDGASVPMPNLSEWRKQRSQGAQSGEEQGNDVPPEQRSRQTFAQRQAAQQESAEQPQENAEQEGQENTQGRVQKRGNSFGMGM